MKYNILIKNALERNEVVKLLRGEQEYEIEVSKFTSDVFPTDINAVLVNCFYKQKDNIENIEEIFLNSIEQLLVGNASDVYIVILYFDACIFQEEKKKATFYIDKGKWATKLKRAINSKKDELQDNIVFANGMKKQNPWRNIENFNKYYNKKYNISIIL